MIETGSKNPKNKKAKAQDKPKENNQYLPIIFILISIVLQFSFYSFDEGDYGIKNNLFGFIGHYTSKLFFYLFGRASYVFPLIGFVSGVILFQRKNANPGRLLISIPFLAISLAIFLNIIGSEGNTLRGIQGNKLGEILSGLLELILGKSGRVLSALGMGVYGLICILRESPKKFDIEFWKRAIQQGKEKLSSIVVPTSEINDEKEIHSQTPPWIEVKKVGIEKRGPIIEDFSKEELPEKKEFKDYSNLKNHIFNSEEKNHPENFRINELKESISRIKKEIENEEKRLKEKIETPPPEIEPEIIFKEASRDLKSKIYKSPIPLPIIEEPVEDERVMEDIYIPINPEEEFQSEMDDSVSEEEMSELLKNEEESDITESNIEVLNDTNSVNEEYFPTNSIEIDEVPEVELEPDKLPIVYNTSVPSVTFLKKGTYKIPVKLFSTNPQKKSDPMFRMEAEYIAKRITDIIKEYGYESKIIDYQKGPIVTRFELEPPKGVKLSRITSLSDELKLYLAAKSIRMVAPIPGKSSIGIEVPNKHRENVFLGDILRERGDELTSQDLNIVLGKDSISGEIISIDLTKLPHLLVAGTTGSGKSVAMNSMISYLIFSKSPEEVRFIMIDPKMVEMTLYENIPHLLLPVITDPRKATRALLWAVQEMESRYSLISDLKCRDIRAYNEKVSKSLYNRIKHKKMPYIVIFIDELSDLMMVSSKELEDYIVRITQKARAVGIHLVMATQRPSVDVITGLIKANCPARIAFHVAQKNDSKIILDYSGADALLGRGDFLYKSPTSHDLQRIQAPFVTEDEIENIVQEAMSYAKAEYVAMNLEEESFKEESDDADEESFDRAWDIVRTERKASASYLQRRLRIGYNKAARLMELMEERGYVGPQIGAKPREILR